MVPALWATAVLVMVLVVVLTVTFLIPLSRRASVATGITIALVVTGLAASLSVLFSAGFTVWPLWV